MDPVYLGNLPHHHTSTMPRSVRVQQKERFGFWLIRQIDSNAFEGVYWLDREKTLFRIPWKHFNIKMKDEKDYGIFKAWAKESGKYIENCENPSQWKTNFRCALNCVTYSDHKMFTEEDDNSNHQQDPHKVFRVNIFRAAQLTPASYSTNTTITNILAEQNPPNFPEENDGDSLLISPNNRFDQPFRETQTVDLLEEILRSTNLQCDPVSVTAYNLDCISFIQGIHLTLPVTPLNGFQPEMPLLALNQQLSEDLYKEPDTVLEAGDNFVQSRNGSAQHFQTQRYHQEHEILNSAQNGPCIEEVFKSDTVYQGPNQHQTSTRMLERGPPMVSNGCTAPVPEPNSTQLTAAETSYYKNSPSIDTWGVNVFYKGKQVLQKRVSGKFVINTGVEDPELGPIDIVCLPSTDELVDQKQVSLTKTILESVGGGLLLEVNQQDFRLYAKRVGKARVFSTICGNLETREKEDEGTKMDRDVPTPIFDFKEFWNDITEYKNIHCESPHYMIYMSFGQNLCGALMRKLVLVQ
ncbi:hypothetical protein GDO86_008653, partial [Hymenochirus boettgeri]